MDPDMIVRGTGSRNRTRRTVAAYLFLLPAIVLFLTFDYAPTFTAVYYSFQDYHVLAPAEWTGLANYKMLAEDTIFKKSLLNSFSYFLIMVPILITLPLFLAILLNQKLRGIYLFRVIYYLPVITSMVAVAIVWEFLFHPAGLLNSVLQLLGLSKRDINWLFEMDKALPAVSAVEIWKAAGFYTIIYLAGLQSISQDLVEAARVDGASRLRILWHVYIPHLRPVIAVTLILSTLGSIQIFTSVYVMTDGGPLDSTVSLPLYIYQRAFVNLDMGYATAMGMLLWAILMILTYLNFKVTRGERTDT